MHEMKRALATLYIVIIIVSLGYTQELRCNVQVVSSRVQGTNKQVFQTLQKEIYEFMNNQAWTNHVYTNEERIECNILINVSNYAGDEFYATIQVQSRRPVFNSSYNSPIINFKDNDFTFKYVEFEPLEFSLNEHRSNLTSVLAYYAYIILGFDYETFAPNGGTPYFQKAEQIVNNAQNAREKGWKAFESRKNRYWLVENMLSSEYSGIRDFLYQYHRLGLDAMSEEPAQGRAQVAESLEYLQKIYRRKPDPFLFLIQFIMDAKNEEFVNIFSESFPSEIDRVYAILAEIDPTRIDKYKKIKEQ